MSGTDVGVDLRIISQCNENNSDINNTDCFKFDYPKINEYVDNYSVNIIFILNCTLCSIIISFLITLGFYFIYKYKKEEHPWKRAIIKSWPWWIFTYITLFLILMMLLYS